MLKELKAMMYGAGDLRMEEFEIDETRLEPDQVLVSTDVSALSTGTDLGNYLGDSTYVPGAPNYPRQVGYSNVGTVVETGAGVKDLKPGDRV
ncbi:MAG: alcohol dehydrogenase catalytic domain-containing protein, partial [Bryobacteraceae bacterium]